MANSLQQELGRLFVPSESFCLVRLSVFWFCFVFFLAVENMACTYFFVKKERGNTFISTKTMEEMPIPNSRHSAIS